MKYQERRFAERIKYYQSLRKVISSAGSGNIVYIDESGFESHVYRTHGFSMCGKRCFGDRPGARKKRINLIAAKRKEELLAPILYEGTTTATWFNDWLQKNLMKGLKEKSTLIMDNAAFHKKSEITEIICQAGHNVIFLPPYSPDR